MFGLLMGKRRGASVSGGQAVTPTLITALSHSVVPSVLVPLWLWLGHTHCLISQKKRKTLPTCDANVFNLVAAGEG